LLTRICLLLLFSAGSALAAVETVDYKVVDSSSSLFRRVDVNFSCPLGGGEVRAGGEDFVLEASPVDNGVELSISFKGKGIEVVQELLPGQEVSGALLQKVEPLSGSVISSKEVQVKREEGLARIEVADLAPGNYRLVFRISTSGGEDSIVAPEVVVLKESPSKETFGGEEVSFTVPLFFGPGEYSLNEKNRLVLKGLKPLVNRCKVRITGYANGTPIVKTKVDSNRELARKRAEAVAKFLEGGGN